jgi:hypothetical protein
MFRVKEKTWTTNNQMKVKTKVKRIATQLSMKHKKVKKPLTSLQNKIKWIKMK